MFRGETEFTTVSFLFLEAVFGRNGSTMAVLWPWRVRSVHVGCAGVPEP